MGSGHTDLLFISPDTREAEAFRRIASSFEYSFRLSATLEELLELELDPDLVVMSVTAQGLKIPAAEVTQACRQQYPEATLILVLPKSLSKAESDNLRKLGVHYLLQETEILTAKPFFAISQILQANYIPVKMTDLVPEVELPFSLFHLMPQRRKFLPLIRKNSRIDSDRFERLKKGTEYYIHRTEVDDFRKFVLATTDRSAKGLSKRCRANFVALKTEFTRLALEISNESEKSSISEGQELLAKCRSICEDLLMNLAEFPKAWEIINNSSVGDFGSLERSPAIAAYCGLFALQGELKRIDDIMLIALLVDLGLLSCNAELSLSLREDRPIEGALLEELRKVPSRSLNLILGRKLAFDEKARSILMGVYEKPDGSGYPAGVGEAKIFLESELIRLAKDFDQRTLIKMGRAAQQPREILSSLMEEPRCLAYTPRLRLLVKEKILPSPIFEETRP